MLAPAAAAETRTGAAADPQDQPAALSGLPKPDIQEINVAYDTAGTLSVAATFFAPLNASASGGKQLEIKVGSAFTTTEIAGTLFASCDSFHPGDVTATTDLTTSPFPSTGLMTVAGFDGALTATRLLSADGRQVTITATHPALADRDYRCAGESSVYIPDRYGHCSPSVSQCNNISYRYTGDSTTAFPFAGFGAPAPMLVPPAAVAPAPVRPRPVPRLSRAMAASLTQDIIMDRLGYLDNELVRYIRCRRLGERRFSCRWLAGGDVTAFEGHGTIARTSRAVSGELRVSYSFTVEKVRLLRSGRFRTLQRSTWRSQP